MIFFLSLAVKRVDSSWLNSRSDLSGDFSGGFSGDFFSGHVKVDMHHFFFWSSGLEPYQVYYYELDNDDVNQKPDLEKIRCNSLKHMPMWPRYTKKERVSDDFFGEGSPSFRKYFS